MRITLFLLSTLLMISAYGQNTRWQKLAPGLKYTAISLKGLSNGGQLHAFEIDLSQYQLDLIFATDYNHLSSSARRLAQESNALIAINGGFFSPEKKPLGLRIQNGETKNNVKQTSWWGVFYIKNNRPRIISQRSFRNNPPNNMEFAIQAGPRLLVNGQIPQLKPGKAERSMIGITQDNKVIIAATERAPLTTTQLATIAVRPLHQGGLAVHNALNLDGGSSTQLYANASNFYLNIPNFSTVSDVITVKARQ